MTPFGEDQQGEYCTAVMGINTVGETSELEEELRKRLVNLWKARRPTKFFQIPLQPKPETSIFGNGGGIKHLLLAHDQWEVATARLASGLGFIPREILFIELQLPISRYDLYTGFPNLQWRVKACKNPLLEDVAADRIHHLLQSRFAGYDHDEVEIVDATPGGQRDAASSQTTPNGASCDTSY